METSAGRHVGLLEEDFEIVPVGLMRSDRETDWHGRVERQDRFGRTSYMVYAADFRTDAFEQRTDQRQHSWAEHLSRIARREGFDALHVFGAYGDRPMVCAYSAVDTQLPLMISFRGVDIDQRIFGRGLPHLRSALGVARLAICVNERSARRLRRLLTPPCPVRVVTNHLNPAAFDPPEPLSLSVEGPILGCSGEFRRVMGLDFLLRAFDELAAERSVSLLLVGPFRDVESYYYSGFIDALRHSHRVMRTGAVEQRKMLSYLAACDILVFPSVSEGSPNKVLEAMLAGRPVVAPDIGGISDLLRHEEEGLIVDCRDQKLLVTALGGLLDDPERCQRYGANGRRRVLEELTPDRERAAWLDCYGEVGLTGKGLQS